MNENDKALDPQRKASIDFYKLFNGDGAMAMTAAELGITTEEEAIERGFIRDSNPTPRVPKSTPLSPEQKERIAFFANLSTDPNMGLAAALSGVTTIEEAERRGFI